jgi:hypothetical protein
MYCEVDQSLGWNMSELVIVSARSAINITLLAELRNTFGLRNSSRCFSLEHKERRAERARRVLELRLCYDDRHG